jgi:hypothetical protein
MSKNGKTILTVIGVIAIAATIYHFSNQDRKTYARMIIKLNGTTGSYVWLLMLDEGYLRAWAKALSKGKVTFSYNNNDYNSSGGKKIV